MPVRVSEGGGVGDFEQLPRWAFATDLWFGGEMSGVKRVTQ